MRTFQPRPLAALLLLASAAAGANQVANGSFEDPVIAAASFQNIAGGSEPPGFGWSVVFNNVDLISTGVLGITGPMAAGSQALDLVGFGTGGAIAQSFATTAGTTYGLQFSYANNPIVTGTASASVQVTAGPATLLSTTVTHDTSTAGNLAWTTYSATFTATGSTATLRFDNTIGGGNGGVFLDAISVTPVPEPTTWGMWLAGLAIGAGVQRWRKTCPG